MKMSICKLIANDIVNYGMDQTSNFNYIVCLDSYIDDFDEESKNYVTIRLTDDPNKVYVPNKYYYISNGNYILSTS